MGKCIKKRYSYSTFFVTCECGFHAGFDMFYWNRVKFCPHCGVRVINAYSTCIECGVPIQDKYGICKSCAEKVGREIDEYVAYVMGEKDDGKE